MAVQTITYDDKIYINQNSNIPNINKVNDTDMNEIKSVVNNNATETSNNTTNITNITGQILWTNPDPTSSFANQTITLSNSNYDTLKCYYCTSNARTTRIKTAETIKGNNLFLEITDTSTSNLIIFTREIAFTSNTEYSAGSCFKRATNAASTDINNLIPLYIVGYKTGLFN